MGERFEQLQDWLHQDLGFGEFTIAPASSDASFRRYFRVTRRGESHIVMDAPPDKEDCGPFIAIAAALAGLGLNVPRVIEAERTRGFLLLTDLGCTPYLPALNASSVERLYGDAMQSLHLLHAAPLAGAGLSEYDRVLLLREMELFPEWFLQRHMGVTLDEAWHAALAEAFTYLADAALAQPRVWVHRDYHSRNLMVTAERNPGVLDFQDAVLGPCTYDLVSLLRDCYIRWPRARVVAWARGYLTRARAAGLLQSVESAEFIHWFDLMGVQRHCKAIGIFARLYHRDGKPGYLADIPRTLSYVLEVMPDHAPLRPLLRLLEERVVPRLQQAPA